MYILQVCLDVVVLSNELLRNYFTFAFESLDPCTLHTHTKIYVERNILFVIFFIHDNMRYTIFINT